MTLRPVARAQIRPAPMSGGSERPRAEGFEPTFHKYGQLHDGDSPGDRSMPRARSMLILLIQIN
jgi:hypothetical protein